MNNDRKAENTTVFRTAKRQFALQGSKLKANLFKGFYSKDFRDIESYLMFIGYPRSGHTLIGALLDAHKDIVISNELNAIKYFKAGFSSKEVYTLIIRNSETVAKRGRKQTGYSYSVPNQWQGSFENLLVIGDKKGGLSTKLLARNNDLFQRLSDAIHIPIKVIHTIRNPYDIITTMCIRKGDTNLETYIAEFFSLCETIVHIKQNSEWAIHDLWHEQLIKEPTKNLRELCHFLGVEENSNYLEDCQSIIYDSPHQSRYEMPWEERLLEEVERKTQEFTFLQGYSYE